MSSSRPKGTTMEGMIFNAYSLLEKAVDKENNGIPPNVVQNCHGVVLSSIVQVGAVLTGGGGFGILLKHDPISQKWSLPVACEVSSTGLGLSLGGACTDVLMFCLNEDTVNALLEGKDLAFGASFTEAFGNKFGRHKDIDINPKSNGTVTFTFSKGAFVDVSVGSAMIRPNAKANEAFYGKSIRSLDIVENKVEMPQDKSTLMEMVYEKLNVLAKGETAETDEASKSKLEEVKVEIDALEEKREGEGEVEVAEELIVDEEVVKEE